MNHLVKILVNDDGDPVNDPKWCLVVMHDGSPRTCCKGEAFGFGESGAHYTEKRRKAGGITCEECLQIIRWFKKEVKLYH